MGPWTTSNPVVDPPNNFASGLASPLFRNFWEALPATGITQDEIVGARFNDGPGGGKSLLD